MQLFAHINVDLATPFLGAATAFVTQLVKNLSAVPINAGQTAKIRTLSAVLAFGGTFMAAWANGDLTSAPFMQYVGVTMQGLVTYFFAHITYKSVIKDPNKY